jgi:hypothetical protein
MPDLNNAARPPRPHRARTNLPCRTLLEIEPDIWAKQPTKRMELGGRLSNPDFQERLKQLLDQMPRS